MVLSFSDWLISLSIKFSRSIHAAVKGKIFFLFMTEWYSIVCMYHSCFTHSFTDGHLGYFQILAKINSVSMNIGAPMFF